MSFSKRCLRYPSLAPLVYRQSTTLDGFAITLGVIRRLDPGKHQFDVDLGNRGGYAHPPFAAARGRRHGGWRCDLSAVPSASADWLRRVLLDRPGYAPGCRSRDLKTHH